MDLTTEQLKEVEFFAHNLRKPPAIARVLGVDEQEFQMHIDVRGNDIANAYYRGREMRITALNKVALDAAEDGSTPALEKVLQILKNG